MARAANPTPDTVAQLLPTITGFYSDLMNGGIQVSFAFPDNGGNMSMNLSNVPEGDPKEIVRDALKSLQSVI